MSDVRRDLAFNLLRLELCKRSDVSIVGPEEAEMATIHGFPPLLAEQMMKLGGPAFVTYILDMDDLQEGRHEQ